MDNTPILLEEPPFVRQNKCLMKGGYFFCPFCNLLINKMVYIIDRGNIYDTEEFE